MDLRLLPLQTLHYKRFFIELQVIWGLTRNARRHYKRFFIELLV